MKKFIYLLILLAATCNMYAFDKVSIKGGLNLACVSGKDLIHKLESKTGLNLGLSASKMFLNGNECQIEVNYTQKGACLDFYSNE